MAEPGSGRPRRLTSASLDRIFAWRETATEADWTLVRALLWSIRDDDWPQRYSAYDDVTYRMRYHIEVRPGLVVTAQYVMDYVSTVQIIFIGSPDVGSPVV